MTSDDPGDFPVRPTGPRPLGMLADLAELLGGDSPRSRTFLGGIVAGALVGAAIAGSSIWRRAVRSRGEARRPE